MQKKKKRILPNHHDPHYLNSIILNFSTIMFLKFVHSSAITTYTGVKLKQSKTT